MQAGTRFGIQTMDAALAGLVRAGKITQDAAFERCHYPEEVSRLLGGAARRGPGRRPAPAAARGGPPNEGENE